MSVFLRPNFLVEILVFGFFLLAFNWPFVSFFYLKCGACDYFCLFRAFLSFLYAIQAWWLAGFFFSWGDFFLVWVVAELGFWYWLVLTDFSFLGDIFLFWIVWFTNIFLTTINFAGSATGGNFFSRCLANIFFQFFGKFF